MQEISKCEAKGTLVINTTKMYYNEQNQGFNVLGRIISGTVKRGQEVKVLGESYTLEEEEDMMVKTITKV